MNKQNETLIQKGVGYVTEINFFHLEEANHQKATETIIQASKILVNEKGFISVNVLVSTDDTRICTYIQWENEESLDNSKRSIEHLWQSDFKALLQDESGYPRLYEVYYTDDRSPKGVSVISKNYQGTVFINEIITIPGVKQLRLLELVISNNVNQSFTTPGYRSANFHKSLDGYRAVNYSLWDSEAHLIEAISSMAEQDINLEETMELASPDFRFYNLVYANHN